MMTVLLLAGRPRSDCENVITLITTTYNKPMCHCQLNQLLPGTNRLTLDDRAHNLLILMSPTLRHPLLYNNDLFFTY